MGFSGGVRAEKRRTFQEKAGAAFDALFDEDQQEQLITLTQREDRVLQKGAELQAWLLEQHLQSDPLADPVVVEALCCPKCRRLGVRDEEEKEAVARPLTTRAGKQELWRYSRKPTAQSHSLRYDGTPPRKDWLERPDFRPYSFREIPREERDMDPLTPNPELYNIPFEASTFNGMPYRTLGHSGLRVPNLGLGTWKFGRPETGDRSRVDSQTAMRIFDRAVELGVTFWDTANRYFSSSGNSERVIGQWLAHNPDQRRNIILATKVYGLMDGLTPNHGGSSRISILASVQACLQRLQTDYIDLLYLHRFDSRTPPEESLAAVEDLVRQGLVRYFAVSNFTCDQLSLYRALEREFSPRVRVLAVQNRFDLLNGEEAQHPGVLAYCAENRISFVAWSPLARGLLTDRYLDLNRVGPGDRLFDEGTLQKDRQGDALVRLQTLAGLAREWELELSQLVLAYTLSLPGMGPLIPAASSEAQIESNAAAGRIILDEQQRQRVRRVLAPAPGSAEDSGGAAR